MVAVGGCQGAEEDLSLQSKSRRCRVEYSRPATKEQDLETS